MKHTKSIKSDRDFRRLYKKGGSFVSNIIVIYYKKNNLNVSRLGITVSKKIGNAVVRNRARRIIKESYRLKEDRIKPGYDIIFVARKRAGTENLASLSAAMDYLLFKSDLII